MATDKPSSYNAYIATTLATFHREAAHKHSHGFIYRLFIDYDSVKKGEVAERAHLKMSNAYDVLLAKIWRCSHNVDCKPVFSALQQLIECDQQRTRNDSSWTEQRCWRLARNVTE